MAESLISDRIIFNNKDGQKIFLFKVKGTLNLSWRQLANLVGVDSRTFKDWSNGKFRMSYHAAKILSAKSCIPIPKNTGVIKWNQHLISASKKGGEIKYKKYGNVGGDESKRKESWRKWWNKEGKFKKQPIFERNQINKPPQNTELAEFTGIMIGDGGISEYRIAITLNSKDDYDYSIFVCKLIEELFDVSCKEYKRKDSLAMDIVVHRKDLVEFCYSIGLNIGDKLKQGLDIPQWIKNNKKYSIACIRGLVDTDGSVFTHKYKVSGKEYAYKKLSFTSCSKPLLNSVYNILKKLGIHSRLHGKDIRIESVDDMKKYFCIIGTSNPKHLKRYEN
jgi:hypothetical protein